MKKLCVVPARGGSKGIPKKNIRMICGKPLLGFVIEAILKAGIFDKTIVSTDSEEIAGVVRKLYPEIEVPFIRPKEFATDNAQVTAVLKQALQYYKNENFELIFSVQPTNPFTRPTSLIEMANVMEQTKCDSIVTLTKILHYHPFRSYKYDKNTMKMSPLSKYTTETFIQKQDRPDAYGLTGGILGRKTALVNSWDGFGLALGDDQRGYFVTEREAFDLDTIFEMEMFEAFQKSKEVE